MNTYLTNPVPTHILADWDSPSYLLDLDGCVWELVSDSLGHYYQEFNSPCPMTADWVVGMPFLPKSVFGFLATQAD